jgi:hypothetical protein
MNFILPILASLSLTHATTANLRPEFQIAASRAEDTCESQVRDRGLQVVDVLETNDHSGGVEVIMRVSRRGDEYTVGCDYSSSSGDVELYRIENDRGGRGDSNTEHRFESDNGDRNDWGTGAVGDRQEAESIARDEVGNQLGIDDPNSDIVEIKDVQRENRNWIVEGEANGAPFRVQIRASDGSVQDFQLY